MPLNRVFMQLGAFRPKSRNGTIEERFLLAIQALLEALPGVGYLTSKAKLP
jgi:hypothetical protein